MVLQISLNILLTNTLKIPINWTIIYISLRAHLFKFYCYLPPFSKDYEREIKKIKSHPKHKHSSTYLYNYYYFFF